MAKKKKKKKKTWDPSKSGAENAKLVLPPLASQFFEAGRKVVEEEFAPADLHPFRLETKRFRYTLELFRPCYGAGLERRLTSLRQIQQYLGEISDCLTTRDLIKDKRAGGSRQTAFLGFLNARAATRAAEFRQYWRETFDRAGQERWWTDYLSRFAGRKGKAGRR
jgi:CHAD domain-containing protein